MIIFGFLAYTQAQNSARIYPNDPNTAQMAI